jgi:hypothetical protein
MKVNESSPLESSTILAAGFAFCGHHQRSFQVAAGIDYLLHG